MFIRVGPEKEPMGTDACMRKLGRTSGNPKQTKAYEGPGGSSIVLCLSDALTLVVLILGPKYFASVLLNKYSE